MSRAQIKESLDQLEGRIVAFKGKLRRARRRGDPKDKLDNLAARIDSLRAEADRHIAALKVRAGLLPRREKTR